MTKTKINSVILFGIGLFGSVSAHAIVQPGWERPIYRADMDVVESNGVFENLVGHRRAEVNLTMTKKDGNRTPTTLILNIDGQTMEFKIKASSDAGCGSFVYQAVQYENDQKGKYELTLTDHTSRICRDTVVAGWEAKLSHSTIHVPKIPGNVYYIRPILPVVKIDGTLNLIGNPEPVYTIQHMEDEAQ